MMAALRRFLFRHIGGAPATDGPPPPPLPDPPPLSDPAEVRRAERATRAVWARLGALDALASDARVQGQDDDR